jgi:hypothetical protein
VIRVASPPSGDSAASVASTRMAMSAATSMGPMLARSSLESASARAAAADVARWNTASGSAASASRTLA